MISSNCAAGIGRPGITPRMRRTSSLKSQMNSRPVACRVKLRPQTYNEVRSGTQTIVCDSCQRILYFNPAEEMADLKPSTTRVKRHHPKIDAPQAWYYRAEFSDIGEVFLCLTTSRGQSSRRIYDVHTGRQIGDILISAMGRPRIMASAMETAATSRVSCTPAHSQYLYSPTTCQANWLPLRPKPPSTSPR